MTHLAAPQSSPISALLVYVAVIAIFLSGHTAVPVLTVVIGVGLFILALALGGGWLMARSSATGLQLIGLKRGPWRYLWSDLRLEGEAEAGEVVWAGARQLFAVRTMSSWVTLRNQIAAASGEPLLMPDPANRALAFEDASNTALSGMLAIPIFAILVLMMGGPPLAWLLLVLLSIPLILVSLGSVNIRNRQLVVGYPWRKRVDHLDDLIALERTPRHWRLSFERHDVTVAALSAVGAVLHRAAEPAAPAQFTQSGGFLPLWVRSAPEVADEDAAVEQTDSAEQPVEA